MPVPKLAGPWRRPLGRKPHGPKMAAWLWLDPVLVARIEFLVDAG